MNKTKVAFICIHNSCRSQMAEGFAKQMAGDNIEIYSAGSEHYHQVKPLAVKAMKELSIDISAQYPKLIADIPANLDYVVSMGCGVDCPIVKGTAIIDWGLSDPSGKGIEEFRITRDIIKNKVKDLVEKINKSTGK